jgi:hypothetical protein
VVDVATKYSCNCTRNCIFKVWTLKCRLLQCDNGQNAESRMLVFYSPDSLERLANAQTTAVTARGTASSKSGHWNVGCWHGSCQQ